MFAIEVKISSIFAFTATPLTKHFISILTAHDTSNRITTVFVLGRYEYVIRLYCTRHVVFLLSQYLSRLFADLVCPSIDPSARECRLVSWRNDRRSPNIPNWPDSRIDIDPVIINDIMITCT